MPPTPPTPVAVPPEVLTGWSRAMEGTEARAEEARDAAVRAEKAVEDMRAAIQPVLDDWQALARARRDAAAKADAERLEAVGGVRSLASSVLGSATLRYLLGMVGAGAAAWFAARYGLDVPPAPQDAAPTEQEATP